MNAASPTLISQRSLTIYIDEAAFPSPGDFLTVLSRIRADQTSSNRYIVRLRSSLSPDVLADILAATPAITCLVAANLALPEGLQRVIRFDLGAPAPAADETSLNAYVSATAGDIQSFGLAFSDAVVEPTGVEGESLANEARRLGKTLIKPDNAADPIASPASDAGVEEVLRRLKCLDPETTHARYFKRSRYHGLFEQCVMEFSAMTGKIIIGILAGAGKLMQGPAAAAAKRKAEPRPASFHLRQLFNLIRLRGTIVASHFASDGWIDRYPSETIALSGLVVQEFDWLDRAALSGARQFRDMIWFAYLLAFAAVLAAAGGHVWGKSPEGSASIYWSGAELLSLGAITYLIFRMSVRRLQYTWTACRIGAEQLRVARMCLPLLMVTPTLLTPDQRDESVEAPVVTDTASSSYRRWLRRLRPAPKSRADEAAVVIALVKRCIRDDGPRGFKPGLDIAAAAKWIGYIIGDQLEYHRKNHDTLRAVESHIRYLNSLIFIIVFGVVIAHLFGVDFEGALLVTAAGPALASAIHGAASRLEISRRCKLSEESANYLDKLWERLSIMEQNGKGSWVELRDIVVSATEAMRNEADAWHATILLEPVTLP